MKINNINNQINFKNLYILNMDAWKPKFLREFVHNSEIQDLTRTLNDEIDILATIEEDDAVVLNADSSEDNFEFYRFKANNEELANFRAQTAIDAYKQTLEDNIKAESIREEVETYLNEFNASLDEIDDDEDDDDDEIDKDNEIDDEYNTDPIEQDDITKTNNETDKVSENINSRYEGGSYNKNSGEKSIWKKLFG